MAPKKRPTKSEKKQETNVSNAYIENAGVVIDQPIVSTIETNYMPYVMSVILSRAIPEIDGFKPSHRKLLYTMYTMGLLNGPRTKSANIVGQTMKLNPHGDAAIYETMVRMARGNESLLYPYVDSKGNFGKAYSSNMEYAAARYTEAKLDGICAELFRDIDHDTVDFVDNYDNTLKEPTLLPVAFPSVLINYNMGIAVGMASNICSFNMEEICNATIKLLRDPDADISDTVLAPDFPGGGYIISEQTEMDKVLETGDGRVMVRAKYSYDQKSNCIEITELPPNVTVEAVIDKLTSLVKLGKLREVSDVRDETDLGGLKLTIDLKRGVDAEKLMNRLFATTPLQNAFKCNFNVLIGGTPCVLGVRPLLLEWIAFREECVMRRVYFDMQKKKDRLHLLKGLEKILLDIDKAIKIVRETEEESEVVPNLMIGFGIDEIQAEYVAEIRLRHLNREYILARTNDIAALRSDIAELESILADKKKIKAVIIDELKNIIKKYAKPRKSVILYGVTQDEEELVEEKPDYPVNVFLTREGYFKKVTPQSLRMSGEHKFKEGDGLVFSAETTNNANLLFFTDRAQVYKAECGDFADGKISTLGDYIPARLQMEDGERVVGMAVLPSYKGYMMFFYENGRVAKVDASAYETKTKRKKLIGAYCSKFPLKALFYIPEETEFMLKSSGGRVLLLHSALLTSKSTKDTQGVVAMQLKKNAFVSEVEPFREGSLGNAYRFRAKNLPSSGAIPRDEDLGEQLELSLLDGKSDEK